MPNTWPYLSSYSFSGSDQGSGAQAELYADNSIRIYKKSSSAPNRNTYTMVHKRCSQSKLATIRAFYAANKYAIIYIYSAETGIINSTYDATGASSTGRHRAVFFSPDGSEGSLSWTNVGRCIYDVEVIVTLLD